MINGKGIRGLALFLTLALLGLLLAPGGVLAESPAAGEREGAAQTENKAALGLNRPALTSASPTERIAGENRYETAVRLAEKGWPSGAHTVILARGDHFADALAGTPLAYMQDAPILLTSTSLLSRETRRALQTLRPQMVIILGGEKAISPAVEHQVKQMGIMTERIAGENRYETAALIAERLGGGTKAIVASGEHFPDALAASSYAAQQQLPILLTQQNRLPEATEAALELVEEAIVVGGEAVVSQDVFEQLPQPRRIAGANRYETAVKVIDAFQMPAVELFVATGEDYADALTGAVLAAKQEAPLLLVEKGRLSQPVKNWLDKRGVHYVTLLGGTEAISQTVARSLGDILTEEVKIPDASLERAVRQTLNKPKAPLTRSDMGGLVELWAWVEGIQDLTGLEYASNLMALDLSFNEVKDLSPLAQLTQLQYLALWGNQVEDIAPLAGLEKLWLLDLDENKIKDLSPLKNLAQLRELYFSGNQVEDLSPLADLDQLEVVMLASNKVKDLSALNHKESLLLLEASDNRLESLPSFHLPNLLGVALVNNGLRDIGPLKDLTSLEELYLDFNQIRDLSPLAPLTNLRYLTLSYNQIDDLTPLTGLSQLVGLSVGNNQIRDLSPLAALSSLIQLEVYNNGLSDLSPLSGLKGLMALDASGNEIRDAAPLAQLKDLRVLLLDDNELTSLAPLGSLTNLYALTLAHNRISDISPLGEMKGMELLDLHHNQVRDLTPLKGMDNLFILDVSENRISDLSPLEEKMLAGLYASQNNIKDLDPVKTIPWLEAILVAQNEIEDIKPLVEYVENGGFLFLADIRGNLLDLSEDSEQLMYVQFLEDMGTEIYYLPQNSNPVQSSQAFDEEAWRHLQKKEKLTALQKQLMEKHHTTLFKKKHAQINP